MEKVVTLMLADLNYYVINHLTQYTYVHACLCIVPTFKVYLINILTLRNPNFTPKSNSKPYNPDSNHTSSSLAVNVDIFLNNV